MHSPLQIGVSACFQPPDPERNVFKGKTLLYVEQSMIHWIMSAGALPILVPTAHGQLTVPALIAQLDGLLLHGGDDVAPETYGATAERPEWSGDVIRDRYDLALIRECLRAGTPILGICRGIQTLNVALGGTLMQDIAREIPDALAHRDWQVYDRNIHDVEIEEGSHLHRVYGMTRGQVNSVHHQAIKRLGRDLVVEARCPADGVIEGVRFAGPSYAMGIQWHPEFQTEADRHLLAAGALLDDFLAEAAKHASARAPSRG